jgi:hypothetical protein
LEQYRRVRARRRRLAILALGVGLAKQAQSDLLAGPPGAVRLQLAQARLLPVLSAGRRAESPDDLVRQLTESECLVNLH